MKPRGSLHVVGTGILGVSHTTLEAIAQIERADQVLYVVPERTIGLWIESLNPNAASMDDLYGVGKDRSVTYAEMADRMMSAVRSGRRLCAVFYGHPGVLAQATHAAIRRLRREGYTATMSPGVSADGCLFADLGVNPGDRGAQSFEANDFLDSRRRFDPRSELILWQVGVLGEYTGAAHPCEPEQLARLVRALRRHYPADHRVVLYSAATLPTERFVARRIRLDRLPSVKVWPKATLYVPALLRRGATSRIRAAARRRASPNA